MSSAGELKDQGNTAFASGKWQEAYELYGKALEFPDIDNSYKATLYSNRALCQLKLAVPGKALEECRHGMRFMPQNTKLRFREGLALAALHRPAEAINVFTKLSNDPIVDKATQELARAEQQKITAASTSVVSVGLPPASDASGTSSPSSSAPSHRTGAASKAAEVRMSASSHANAMELMAQVMKGGGRMTPQQEAQLKAMMGGGVSMMPTPATPVGATAAAGTTVSAAGSKAEDSSADVPTTAPSGSRLRGVWATAGGASLAQHIRLVEKANPELVIEQERHQKQQRERQKTWSRSNPVKDSTVAAVHGVPVEHQYLPLVADGAAHPPATGRACVVATALVVRGDCVLMVNSGPAGASLSSSSSSSSTGEGGDATTDTSEVKTYQRQTVTPGDSSDALTEKQRKANAARDRALELLKDSKWYLPSTAIRAGETPNEAITRCLNEQCRITTTTSSPSSSPLTAGVSRPAFIPEVHSIAALEDAPSLCRPVWFKLSVIASVKPRFSTFTSNSKETTASSTSSTSFSSSSSSLSSSDIIVPMITADGSDKQNDVDLDVDVFSTRPANATFAWVPRSLVAFDSQLPVYSTDYVNLFEQIPRLWELAGGVASALGQYESPLLVDTSASSSSAAASALTSSSRLHWTGASLSPITPLTSPLVPTPLSPAPASEISELSSHFSLSSSSSTPSVAFAHHLLQLALLSIPRQNPKEPAVLLCRPPTPSEKSTLVKAGILAASSPCDASSSASASASPCPSQAYWMLPTTHIERTETVLFASRRLSRATFGLMLEDFGCARVEGGYPVAGTRLAARDCEVDGTKVTWGDDEDGSSHDDTEHKRREDEKRGTTTHSLTSWFDDIPEDQDSRVRGYRITVASSFLGGRKLTKKDSKKEQENEKVMKESSDSEDAAMDSAESKAPQLSKEGDEETSSDDEDDSEWFPSSLVGGSAMWPPIDRTFNAEVVPDHCWVTLDQLRVLSEQGLVRQDLVGMLASLLRRAQVSARAFSAPKRSGHSREELSRLGIGSLISIDSISVQQQQQ